MRSKAFVAPVPAKRPLPGRLVRWSKRLVALAALVIAVGLALIVGPWAWGALVGGLVFGIGLTVLLTASYYWGCGNESCS